MGIKPPNWSATEVEFLSDMGDSLPPAILIRRFQRQAKAEGWPDRSEKAIRLKLGKLGFTSGSSRIRIDDLLSPGGAALILGCPVPRIVRWLYEPQLQKLLRPVLGGCRRYVSRRGWRRLAHERPDVLGGFGADRLFQLLEDRELADAVAAAHPYQRGDYRIRCIETGQTWPNARQAANELFVSRSAICLAILEQRPVAALGLRFERLRGAA
jgi:hypothetical protein